MKKIISVYLPQVLLIVFSVVLGMYLNQKMMERSDRNKAKQLISLIESEVKLNNEMLKDLQPYHQEMRIALDSLRKDDRFLRKFQEDKSELYQIMTRGTLMSDFVSNSAYEMTKINPVITQINFDKMNMITKTYIQQNATFSPIQNIIKLFNTPYLNSPENAKENLSLLSSLLREMVSREVQLLEFYKMTIEMLEKE